MAGIFIGSVSGFVAKDPEIKQVGGSTVANFSIPVSSKIKGEEKTTWVRIAVWGKRAETIGQYVKKGSFLAGVTGVVTERSYEKDGQTRTSLELNASEFAFGPKQDTGAPAASNDSDVEPF